MILDKATYMLQFTHKTGNGSKWLFSLTKRENQTCTIVHSMLVACNE